MDSALGSPGVIWRDGAGLLDAQVRQLHAGASLGFTATLVNSLILVAVLRNEVAPPSLVGWWMALAAVTVVRFFLVRRFHTIANGGPFDARWWTSCFDAGIGISGIVWGLSGIVLFPGSIPHQTFIAFVLGGMVAGAAATFSVRMETFLAFAVPALTPLVVRLFSEGDEFHIAMGSMVLLFGLLLTGTAFSVHKQLKHSTQLAQRVSELDRELREASEQALELSVQLEGSTAALQATEFGSYKANGDEEEVRSYLIRVIDSLVTVLRTSAARHQARMRIDMHAERVEELEREVRTVCKRMAQVNALARGYAALGLRHGELGRTEAMRETLEQVVRSTEQASSLIHELIVCADNARDFRSRSREVRREKDPSQPGEGISDGRENDDELRAR